MKRFLPLTENQTAMLRESRDSLRIANARQLTAQDELNRLVGIYLREAGWTGPAQLLDEGILAEDGQPEPPKS